MNWSHSLNQIIHPDNTVRQKRMCSHWFHRIRDMLPWAVRVHGYIVHTVVISKRMHTDLGRSRPLREETLRSGQPEICFIWQSSEKNNIGGNFNLILHQYQLIHAGFIWDRKTNKCIGSLLQELFRLLAKYTRKEKPGHKLFDLH